MRVNWVLEAKKKYYDTLDYWEEHNGSFDYSLKIIQAVETLEDELAEAPYFLAKYSEQLDLYRKYFLNKRFIVYYKVYEELGVIEIRDLTILGRIYFCQINIKQNEQTS